MPGPCRTTQELMQIFGKGRGQTHREELHGHRPFDTRMRLLPKSYTVENQKDPMDETKVCQCSVTLMQKDPLCQHQNMPGLHKCVSTQHTNQQVLAKPRHQPSERDQQARERLKQKAKIKSCAYIQLGEKVLQIVHQTFEPDIPVILHLPALENNTIDTDTVPLLYVIQEGINCIPTTDYFFTNIKPEPIVVTRHTAQHSKPTAQQAATQDPVSQQTHPLWPGETRVYPPPPC